MISGINMDNFTYTPPEKTGDELTDQITELMAYREWQENQRKRINNFNEMFEYLHNVIDINSGVTLNTNYIKNKVVGIQ